MFTPTGPRRAAFAAPYLPPTAPPLVPVPLAGATVTTAMTTRTPVPPLSSPPPSSMLVRGNPVGTLLSPYFCVCVCVYFLTFWLHDVGVCFFFRPEIWVFHARLVQRRESAYVCLCSPRGACFYICILTNIFCLCFPEFSHVHSQFCFCVFL